MIQGRREGGEKRWASEAKHERLSGVCDCKKRGGYLLREDKKGLTTKGGKIGSGDKYANFASYYLGHKITDIIDCS